MDQLTHTTTIEYPDKEIKDEYDLLIALVDSLNIKDEEQKNKYKSLFVPNTNINQVLEELTSDYTMDETFKNRDIRTWLQFVLGNFFESLFFKWIEN